ncbi:MAG TPA: hypothetical protein VGW98_03480 [Solirubrobacteraceae bacterium]|jgi:hypothetical protein|nr:hypothetical protein [Solirubrobacteraceae bacterium]
MKTTDWATVGTAAFAAVAAGASWASVWQNRRERIAARTPAMALEPQYVEADDEVRLYIFSNGGPAREVHFLLVSGAEVVAGIPRPTSLFRSGESRCLKTRLSKPETGTPPPSFIACYDISGKHFYAWSGSGEERVYTQHRWQREPDVSDEALMKAFYPEVDYSKATKKKFDTSERTL